MNIALASALARGQWAIDPIYAINQLGLVEQILSGQVVVERAESDPIISVLHPAAASASASRQGNQPSFVAVTKLVGPLMKSDQECGPAGMATIGRYLQSRDADASVIGHVLVIDSPGGTVDGTEVFGNLVKSLEKPVVAYVDGLCASAALWIGSNADEMIASTELDEIGSVGVLLSFKDFQPAYEKMGVKQHNVVSSLSPDKIKMFEDLRAGKYDTYIKERLDPIAEKFQQVIRANFPNVDDKHLTGKIFHARDLIGIMVNSIGTLQDAVARVSELSAQKEPIPVSQINTLSTMKFPKLLAALGITELAVVDGFSTLSEENLQAIESALADAPEIDATAAQENALAIQQAVATISERDERIVALEQQLQIRDQLISEHEQTISGLRNDPAEETAAVVTKTDPDPDAGSAGGPVVNDSMDTQTAMKVVKEAYGL